MNTSSHKPFLPSLVKYSTLSVVALSLTSPLMAIERPVPAEQPIEKKVAPKAGPDRPDAGIAIEEVDADAQKLTYLGVYGGPINETLSHHLKLEKGLGIELELIAPGSPASKATLKKRDIIIKIADKKITSMADIRKVVTDKKSGDVVEIQLISEGKKVTKKVTLSERAIPKAVRQVQPRLEQELGIFPNQDMLKMGLPKELLEQFPEKDRERLMKLFKGGAFENNFKDLEKQFGELNELIPNMPEANPRMNFQDNFQSRVKMLDQHGSITLESNNEGKVIELKDKHGKVQYRGPYNNALDKESVPEELRGRVDNLDIDNKMDLFKQPKLDVKPKLKLKLKLPNQPNPEGRMRLEFDQLPQQNNNGNIKQKKNFKNSIKFSETDDATGIRYTYASMNGNIHVEIHDRAGKLLFDGPYKTDLDKASVPEEYKVRLKKLSRGKDKVKFRLEKTK